MANSNCSSAGSTIIWQGKISALMGDVAKGIKSFKKGMSDNPDLSNKDSEDKDNSNSN